MIKNVYLSPCEVPVIVVTHEAKSNLKFLNTFSKNNQKWNFKNIRPTGAGTDDGRAGMTRITVAFHDFANASNNESLRLQDTFLTMHGYVYIPRNFTRCTLLISKLQGHINETLFFFSEALISRWPVWEMLSYSCPYVCSLMVDKSELIGWDCALLAGNKWQLNEMLEVLFLPT